MSDDQDQRLLGHVRPAGWRNPAPKPRYDLVVIGGGTAGLVCAAGAAGLGARVALVERSRLGGDCLNTGCVPSKALLRSARVVGEIRRGRRVGVTAAARVDFHAVMTRLRARRADIAPHDSAARLASLGVDVFFGTAAFAGPHAVAVHANGSNDRNDPNDRNRSNGSNGANDSNGSTVLRFRRAVIATGSRPAVPPIPGLAEIAFLTSETLFDLVDQPVRLAVLGGGPIGCEMAQAFARLGTRVTLVEAGPRLLPREDPDAAAIVARALAEDGVEIVTGSPVSSVVSDPAGIRLLRDGGEVTADKVLVATGRVPNLDGLGLERAGVAADADGVRVDDRLRTTNAAIYASGDVASRYKFTHAADALSRVVIQNALFFGRKRASALVIPWCTFTDPEVAHVGLTSAEAEAQQAATLTVPLADVDRAVVDEEMDGFVRIHHRQGRIVGATIVGPTAGELIGTVTSAMVKGGSVADWSAVAFPYPTLSLALRQAGDLYRRTRVTPAVRRALDYYFRWRR